MKKILFMLTTASVVIWGCTRETIHSAPTPPAGETKTVTLTVDASTLSRVGHTDNNVVEVVWKSGDELLVVDALDAASTSIFTLNTGEETNLGVFSGTVPTTTGTLNVYYPATIGATPINYALQTQSGNASMAHFANNDLMFATGVEITAANTASATLAHAGIIFTIPIANNTGEEQEIVGVTIADRKADTEINFSGSVQLTNGTLTDTKAASLDLIFPMTVAVGETATANVVAYLTNYGSLAGTDKFDIFVHTKTGRYMNPKTGIAMTAGTRYTISGVAMNATNFQSDLYLLGDAFETVPTWEPTGKFPATNNQDGTYTWSGPLFEGSSFRFSNIGDTWGSQTFEILDAGDGTPIAVNANPNDDIVPNFSVPAEGLYDVKVDFTKMQAILTKTDQRFIYPVGSATPYGWTLTPGNYMRTYAKSGTEETISETLSLTSGTSGDPTMIKFTRRATFDFAVVEHLIPLGGSKTFTPGVAEGFDLVADPTNNGKDFNWLLTEGMAGDYTITINYTLKTILFERETPNGIALPDYRNGTF